MHCFSCGRSFRSLDLLVKHFKYYHSFNSLTTYTCCEDVCTQSFKSLSSFKRHILLRHKSNNDNDNEFEIIHDLQEVVNSSNTPINESSLSFNNGCENVVLNESIMSCEESTDQVADSISNPNFSLINNNLKNSAAKLTIQILSKSNFTTKDVFEVQENFNEFISNSIVLSLSDELKREMFKSLNDCVNIKNYLSNCTKIFDECNTEYRLLKWMQENDLLAPLKIVNINQEISIVHNLGETRYEELSFKAAFIPLSFQFKKIFQKGNTLKETLERQQNLSLDYDVLTNFVQGKLWKSKIKNFNGKIVIPYFLYTDDFEINNPLGTHAGVQALTALYFSFPTSYSWLKLDDIFLAGFVNSKDIKNFGNKNCLTALVKDLIDLEVNGLLLTTEDGTFRVHFILGLIQGDNLGLNEILGFVTSFVANYFCRLCKLNKSLTHSCCKTADFILRTIENYSTDINTNDAKLTGIKEICIFNDIPTFHVTSNYYVDYMHDVPGGIMHYLMSNIIIYYTETIKLFSLEKLNSRKQNFNYGAIEIGNKSEAIKNEHLKNKRLKMSSREMLSFVHNFSMMVGDLVSEDDEVWLFFISFLKINDMLMSYSFSGSEIILLRISIEKFNAEYIRVFGEILRPKFHFFLHYANIIEQSGPPRLYWCFLFETKHKETKIYAHAINNRKNPPITFSKKCQIKFASFLLSEACPSLIVKCIHETVGNSEFISQKLNETKNNFKSYSKIIYKGTVYKNGYFLTTFENDNVHLFEIVEAIILNSDNIYILCSNYELAGFSSHHEAYIVKGKDSTDEYTLKNLKDFNGPPINVILTAKGQSMVRLREIF